LPNRESIKFGLRNIFRKWDMHGTKQMILMVLEIHENFNLEISKYNRTIVMIKFNSKYKL